MPRTSEHTSHPLRTWRSERGYSLADLAGLSGISRSMLSRVERGQRRLSPAKRVALARSVGASVDTLFTADYASRGGR